jgi:hypothetical protein
MGRNEAFLKNSLLVVGCTPPALGLKGQGVWDFGVEKSNVRKPLLVFRTLVSASRVGGGLIRAY